MSLNNRYVPSHPAGQTIVYGLDFANILPEGVTIASGSVTVQYNTVPPTPTLDLTVNALPQAGRRMYARVSGGGAGRDYRLQWTANDNLGDIWIRTTLLLCAATS